MTLSDVRQHAGEIHKTVYAAFQDGQTIPARELALAQAVIELTQIVSELAKSLGDVQSHTYSQNSGFFYNGRSY